MTWQTEEHCVNGATTKHTRRRVVTEDKTGTVSQQLTGIWFVRVRRRGREGYPARSKA